MNPVCSWCIMVSITANYPIYPILQYNVFNSSVIIKSLPNKSTTSP